MSQIAELPDRALIRLEGPDKITFLKGLCTAPVERLSEGPVHGAFLRPQGKIICDLVIVAQPDTLHLILPASQRDDMLAKLRMYRLRAKVDLEASSDRVCVVMGESHLHPDPRGGIVGAPFGWAFNADATTSADEWRRFRVQAGIAEAGTDYLPDTLYAIDANLDLLDGIDFHKGCYVGQELTSRMKRRGQIKNRVVPLRHDGVLTSGADIFSHDRKIGECLSSIEGLSLALIRLDRVDDGPLTCDKTPVTLAPPAWLAPYLVTQGDAS